MISFVGFSQFVTDLGMWNSISAKQLVYLYIGYPLSWSLATTLFSMLPRHQACTQYKRFFVESLKVCTCRWIETAILAKRAYGSNGTFVKILPGNIILFVVVLNGVDFNWNDGESTVRMTQSTGSIYQYLAVSWECLASLTNCLRMDAWMDGWMDG